MANLTPYARKYGVAPHVSGVSPSQSGLTPLGPAPPLSETQLGELAYDRAEIEKYQQERLKGFTTQMLVNLGAITNAELNLNDLSNPIYRCEGTQANSFENLGVFAAAVTEGNLAGLPAQNLNLLAGGYLVSRVLFNVFYITGTTPAMATGRSVSYFAGLSLVMTLFVQSGNALRASALV
jgi:uncharacterized MAPEG superfamily protein